MDPFSLITGAKTSIDAALNVAKIYKDAKGVIDEIEQGIKIVEIKSNLLDAKQSIFELRDALIQRDEEIQKLKDELKKRNEVIYEAPVYWHIKENGQKDGPFCQKCFDKDNKLIRLQIQDHDCEGAWNCKVCDSFYETSGYVSWREFTLNEQLL